MRKLFCLILVILCCAVAFANDIIVMRNGDLVNAKVIDITQTEIKYKKASNPNGPTYTISKIDVLAINYENGDKDTFEAQKGAVQEADKTDTPKVQQAQPDSENSARINAYNTRHPFNGKKVNPNKVGGKAKYWIGTLGIDEESVLSSNDLNIDFKTCESTQYKNRESFRGHFEVILTNKSNSTIYVDLGNTFRVDQNGNYRIYYDGKSTSVSHGSGGGAGLNLGGVASALGIGGAVGNIASGLTVGGGKNSAYTTNYSTPRILAIPPKGSVALSKENWVDNKIRTSTDEYFWDYTDLDPDCPKVISIQQNEHHTYDRSVESPMSYKYMITYSTDENFSNIQFISACTYLKDVIGTNNSAIIWLAKHTNFLQDYFGSKDLSKECIVVLGACAK